MSKNIFRDSDIYIGYIIGWIKSFAVFWYELVYYVNKAVQAEELGGSIVVVGVHVLFENCTDEYAMQSNLETYVLQVWTWFTECYRNNRK